MVGFHVWRRNKAKFHPILRAKFKTPFPNGEFWLRKLDTRLGQISEARLASTSRSYFVPWGICRPRHPPGEEYSTSWIPCLAPFVSRCDRTRSSVSSEALNPHLCLQHIIIILGPNSLNQHPTNVSHHKRIRFSRSNFCLGPESHEEPRSYLFYSE